MEKTLFKVNPSDKAAQFLQLANVPKGLLAPFSFDLSKILATANIGNQTSAKLLPVAKQIEYFTRLRIDYSPYVAIVCSVDNYSLARQISTVIFWAHLQHCLNNDKLRGSMPHWLSVINDFKNEFMDNYNDGLHAAANLLVLDNIYADMPSTKLDKVIDVLQTLCDRPRLILFRGKDAYKYCVETLGVRPNMLLNVSKRQQIQRI